MAVFLDYTFHDFPDYQYADEDGLLAIGGLLSLPVLKRAYQGGIFPWYNPNEPPLWWCPDPRCVIFTDAVTISKSMQQVIRSGRFEYRFNTSFSEVIRNCREVYRRKQQGTWITDEFISLYTEWHNQGTVCSAETYCDNILVGGLYGVRMGNMFCGESMFSLTPNASKFALIHLAKQLYTTGVPLIDCQIPTPHLESMGAVMIPRREFLSYL
jgi:leucyl/phenylalanyl-tRNA--protein transferase